MNTASGSARLLADIAIASVIASVITSATAHAQAATCNQAPGPNCLYVPAASYGFTEFERRTSYTDNAGEPREVQVLIRQPVGALAPLPVVVWSHGGADGECSPATSMAEWQRK